MNISELADEYLGGPSQPFLGIGPASRAMHEIFQSESITSPLIATTFWQAFIESSLFAKSLWAAGASHSAVFNGERFVVSHGSGWRQDLVVLDPNPSSASPIVVRVDPYVSELVEGWERFRNRMGLSDPKFRLWEGALIEASKAQPFGLIVAPRPPVTFTRCPSPPWTVTPSNPTGNSGPSTAGIVAKNQRNQVGVTCALHALGSATQVSIDGRAGTVVSQDAISDSGFIEVSGCPLPPQSGLAGPLQGVTPRVLDPVRFEGQSGPKGTIVTGWSPDLPFVLPYSQLKVLTKPDTIPGDSGAALIDNADHIVGFAFYRTGFGAPIEYSSWIWAASVFAAHNLSVV